MPNIQRGFWLLAISGLLILCIWQWLRNTTHYTQLLDQNTLEQTANVIIYDLKYRQYNANGTVLHFLETPKMRHIPKNNKHILTTPHLIVTEPDKEPWEMHAELGTAVNKTEMILLDRHVLINQHKNNEEMVLKTEHLTYFPEEKRATTHEEVTMIQGGTHIRSTGLVANLADNQIHLQNARGRHVQSMG
ncbi:MAG: LPS export ABC transporter periplasmic protein LptC [Gammaproteobacteria bacterium]